MSLLTDLILGFGEADIAGRKALISLKRLRQEFYSLPRNENLFRERAVKEAVHELGHTYGLKHCPLELVSIFGEKKYISRFQLAWSWR